MTVRRPFGERVGVTTPRVVQLNELDRRTKVALSNFLDRFGEALDRDSPYENPYTVRGRIARRLLADEFHRRLRELPATDLPCWREMLDVFDRSPWYEILGAVEAFASIVSSEDQRRVIRDSCNTLLERHSVGYRFAGDLLVPLTTEVELDAVAAAVQASADRSAGVHQHLTAAMTLLRSAEPDYRNSIKESVSAVEAAARLVADDSTLVLGRALVELERRGVLRHPAFRSGWSSLFAWAGDAGGIRHGAPEPAEVGLPEALCMLASSSAFVSYLLSLSHAR